jgi:hypothetical protein
VFLAIYIVFGLLVVRALAANYRDHREKKVKQKKWWKKYYDNYRDPEDMRWDAHGNCLGPGRLVDQLARQAELANLPVSSAASTLVPPTLPGTHQPARSPALEPLPPLVPSKHLSLPPQAEIRRATAVALSRPELGMTSEHIPFPPRAARPVRRGEAGPARRGEAKLARRGEVIPARRGEAKPARRGEAKPARRGEAKPARRDEMS